ncbi:MULTISPECIES: helix-turn-helix domain-containing protein [unclassified Streptomyces]|uniref:helix-turn-helix domain-containing protein n=1 Tax=Streptomyces sp. ST1015 TaxID=1848900 RepID=UPI000DD7B331|nr:helix-turn-helix transcriptional regulator [Streptomyces sp. ST1015]
MLQHRAGQPLGVPSGQSLDFRAVHRRFLDALELRFRELHHVDDYARLPGCSVRTLTRAAQDAGHAGARQVIDERRLLEASRLLGPATWTASAVAAHLGFPDPADFGRFFRHHAGLTPAAWATRAEPRHTNSGPHAGRSL